jgi:hypothetical protein
VEIHDEIRRSSNGTRWEASYDRLPAETRARLAKTTVDILVRRAARRLDFDSVRRLLELAGDFDVGATPLRLQAAELLQRLAAWQRSAPRRSPPVPHDRSG